MSHSSEAERRIAPLRSTRKGKVLAVLVEANGKWVNGTVLESPEVGGSQGTRRVRELRSDGWPVQLRPNPKSATTWQYRIKVKKKKNKKKRLI